MKCYDIWLISGLGALPQIGDIKKGAKNMNYDEIMNEMKLIAEENGYELTENAEKIAKFRARTGLPMSQCPCSPKENGRGCIGPVCREELETYGVCHCNCFRSIK